MKDSKRYSSKFFWKSKVTGFVEQNIYMVPQLLPLLLPKLAEFTSIALFCLYNTPDDDAT